MAVTTAPSPSGNRALIVWDRLILPNGASLHLENLPVNDASGHAGLTDEVDFRTWSLIKGVMLSTLLNVGSELTLGGEGSGLARALGRAVEQAIDTTGEAIVRRELGVQQP